MMATFTSNIKSFLMVKCSLTKENVCHYMQSPPLLPCSTSWGPPPQTPDIGVMFARDLLLPALISCPFCHCPLSLLPLFVSTWGFSPSVHSGLQQGKKKKNENEDVSGAVPVNFASVSKALSPLMFSLHSRANVTPHCQDGVLLWKHMYINLAH